MFRAAIWTRAHTYLEPDLFYISASAEARLGPEPRTSADLVIEVVSPGSAIYDRNTKADTYGAPGVKELCLVDGARRQVEVRNRIGNGFGEPRKFSDLETTVSKLLPGFGIDMKVLYDDRI